MGPEVKINICVVGPIGIKQHVKLKPQPSRTNFEAESARPTLSSQYCLSLPTNYVRYCSHSKPATPKAEGKSGSLWTVSVRDTINRNCEDFITQFARTRGA